MRIGRAVPATVVAGMESDEKATEYLRWRTHLLAQRSSEKARLPAVLLPVLPKKWQERLTRPVATEALLSDIDNLRTDQILDDGREFTVFTAREAQVPNLLPELGRLREVTFREAGEGTGCGTDLDAFDSYYDHVMLWHKQKQELVGAYRLGNTTDILPQRGVAGLFTSSLFQYDTVSSENFAQLWNWVAGSYVPSINASTHRCCCCCGRELRATLRHIPKHLFCLEPSVLANVTRGRPAI